MLRHVESRACAACFEAPLLLLEYIRGWDTKALPLMGYPCRSFSCPTTVLPLQLGTPSLPQIEKAVRNHGGEGRGSNGGG